MNQNPQHLNGPLCCMPDGCAGPDAESLIPAMPHIQAFVYGTLKRGFGNHERYCRSAIGIAPEAVVVGRLYALPAGYPALEIPDSSILAHGTPDPLADAATEARYAAGMDREAAAVLPEGDWGLVHGELLRFANPGAVLPPIDRLEGFQPGRRSYYQRVLIPVWTAGLGTAAWTYIMPGCGGHQRLLGGVWPPQDGVENMIGAFK